MDSVSLYFPTDFSFEEHEGTQKNITVLYRHKETNPFAFAQFNILKISENR